MVAKNHLIKKIVSIAILFTSFVVMAQKTTVVIFIIDGLQTDAAKTAAANGADNIKFAIENGVMAERACCVSPSPYLRLPDNSLPWGTTSPPNVAIHTGCHVFDSRKMDDIFLSARTIGIKSVFAGGAENYDVFTTPDFYYVGNTMPDSVCVQYGIDHFKQDNARLIRLHPQRARDHWSGPAGKTDPDSDYIRHIIDVDRYLGHLIQALKDGGVWDSTFLIISADHGMGQTRSSDHPPHTASSWLPFMCFYGPGIKQGDSIPYAESPDIAIMTNYFFGLPRPEGHTDPDVTITPKVATGTFLENIFEGKPREINHPRYIERYLDDENWEPEDEFVFYRAAMLELLKDFTVSNRRDNYRQSFSKIRYRYTPQRLWIQSEKPFNKIELINLLGKKVLSRKFGDAGTIKTISINKNVTASALILNLTCDHQLVGRKKILLQYLRN